MSKGSRNRTSKRNQYKTNWERIYGHKKQNSDSSPGARSDAGPEGLGDKADGKEAAPWCTRPQIP